MCFSLFADYNTFPQGLILAAGAHFGAPIARDGCLRVNNPTATRATPSTGMRRCRTFRLACATMSIPAC
jgi:hypothetical protein